MPANLLELLIINTIAAIPPTVAAVAALVTAWRLKDPVRHTTQRVDQLYNGEFARGEVAGRQEERAARREFTLR